MYIDCKLNNLNLILHEQIQFLFVYVSHFLFSSFSQTSRLLYNMCTVPAASLTMNVSASL